MGAAEHRKGRKRKRDEEGERRHWNARAPASGSSTLSEALARAKRERTRARNKNLQVLKSAQSSNSRKSLVNAVKLLSRSLHIGFAESALHSLSRIEHRSYCCDANTASAEHYKRCVAEFANACARAGEPYRGLRWVSPSPNAKALAQSVPQSAIPVTIITKCLANNSPSAALLFIQHLRTAAPNVRTFNALLRSCVWHCDGQSAYNALNLMRDSFALQPDRTSFDCAIKALCSNLELSQAKHVLQLCLEHFDRATPAAHVALAQCMLACYDAAHSGANADACPMYEHVQIARSLAEEQETSFDGSSSLAMYLRFSSRDLLDECDFLMQARARGASGYAKRLPTPFDWHSDPCVAFRKEPDQNNALEAIDLSAFEQVHLELCSGNGDWAIEAVHSGRLHCVVAVESRTDRVNLTWHKIRRNNLANRVIVVCGDAKTVMCSCFKANSVASITVNFPEPPVYAGSSARLVDETFVQAASTLLEPCGRCTVVTDNAYYALDIQRLLKKHAHLFNGQENLMLGIDSALRDSSSTYFDKFFSAGNRSDRFTLTLQKHGSLHPS